jgi:H+/Cl- antiporter ClcA
MRGRRSSRRLALLVTLAVATWVTRVSRPSTAELYIVTYHTPGGRLPLRQIPGRVLGAMTTVAFGGSQGLESASALIGAAAGDLVGHARDGARRLVVPEDDKRSLMVAGASAGIAAVFSSPAVGALYGIEIPFRRDVDARRLVPCAVAAGCSFAVRDWLIGGRYLAMVDAVPRVDATFVAGVLLVGIGCGLAARLFARAADELKDLGRRVRPLARAAIAGAVLAGLAWAGHALAGSWITFGPGYVAADWLRDGGHPIWLLVATLLVRRRARSSASRAAVAAASSRRSPAWASSSDRSSARRSDGPSRTCFRFSARPASSPRGIDCRSPASSSSSRAPGSFPVAIAGLVAIAIGQVLMQEDSVSDAKRDARLD